MNFKKYKTTGTAIVHEFLDDEVIVANLDSGIYYSIRGVGIPVWEMLTSGYQVEDVEKILLDKFQTDQKPISAAVHETLKWLLEEKLLVEQDNDQVANVKTGEIHFPASFIAPVCEKYDEMRNLLMLDPVHEVDEQGWPKAQ